MPATDPFYGKRSLDGPGEDADEIVPHDANELTYVTRAIYVGGAGNMSVVTAKGTSVVFTGLPAGIVLPVRIRKVLATGTTATNLVAIL
jgi:hypothetical protein